MKMRVVASASVICGLLLASVPVLAHHAIAAKFDDKKPMTFSGIVTSIDWKNPHVHIFMNVKNGQQTANWAVELASPIQLEQSGWKPDTVKPGDTVKVQGIAARNGSKQVWGNSVVVAKTGHQVFALNIAPPPAPLSPRPTPRWPDKQPRLGSEAGGVQGYWAFPTSTTLVENGTNVAMNRDGLLKNIGQVLAPRCVAVRATEMPVSDMQ